MKERKNILEVKNLSVSFDTPEGEIEAVRNVSFDLKPGEILAIVGESGCGKSVLCKTIMKLIPSVARIKSGTIWVNGADITDYGERDMRKLRGSLFSMIFQDPMTALNPTISIGKQIAEAVRIHNRKMMARQIYERVIQLMKLVGIGHPEEHYSLYPHHLSGGMRQRAVMAIALASNPKILFADEPTTSLDVTIQAQILDLLREIRQKLGTATVFVTHNLGAAARVADRIAVIYAGKIVEIGTAEEIFYDPRHPYTWGLMHSIPAFADRNDRLYAIPGMPPVLINPPKGDAFALRNEYALAIDYEEAPPMFRITDTHYAATWLLDDRAPKIQHPAIQPVFQRNFTASSAVSTPHSEVNLQTAITDRQQPASTKNRDNISSEVLSASHTPADIDRRSAKPEAQHQSEHNTAPSPLIDIRHVSHDFSLSKKITLWALEDVTLQIHRGEIFGLVGESGSGKSTLARCIMNIYQPSQGQIFYDGINTCDHRQLAVHKKRLQTERQLIFQDSGSSLNQRMRAEKIITEPLSIHGIQSVYGTDSIYMTPKPKYEENSGCDRQSQQNPEYGERRQILQREQNEKNNLLRKFFLHRTGSSSRNLRVEAELLAKSVGLDSGCLNKYPSELSGGQRQRIAIARALSMQPRFLVADEPVASLDVSIQAQIINLFRSLQKKHGFTLLFIAHDLTLVRYLCDRVGVMHHGRLIETAPTEELFENPQHPYTKALLSAIPVPDPRIEKARKFLTYDAPYNNS